MLAEGSSTVGAGAGSISPNIKSAVPPLAKATAVALVDVAVGFVVAAKL